MTKCDPAPHVVDLPLPIPNELVSDFLGKLHYVSEDMKEFLLADSCHQVIFETKPGREVAARVISDRILEVAAKMCGNHRGYEPRVLVARRRATFAYVEDPRRELIAAEQLHEYGPGRFGLGPRIVALIEYFEGGLLRLADRLEARRYQFPSLVGADVLDRCRYIQSFPHALTLTAHLREDLETIQDFARQASVNDGRLSYQPEQLSGVKCLLSPTICFHYYDWLRDTRPAKPHTITALGRCFRYESGGLSSLERLWDFSMREIVFVGSQDYVQTQRARCIEAATALLEEWDLSFEIKTATDPFFIDGYSTQAAFQSAFELKYEIRADLPYEQAKTLAIGSFNFHQDFFGRSFNIELTDGAACTGCVGFGMERLAWAFVAQHGPEPDNWPAGVRSGVLRKRPHG